MDIKGILLILFIIVLLFVVISYIMKDVNTLTGLEDGKTMKKVDSSDLDTGDTSSSTSNFAYSIWFFVDDWNYRYGEPKVIFGRMSGGDGPCPLVVLGPTQNNLIITIQVYPGSDSVADTNDNNSIVHTCNVANVPLQKWVNLIISAYGRSLDVYIDGKLVRTCVLPGVSKIDGNAAVFVTPKGGFSGWTSTLQYWPDSCDPQKAWDIYRKGYGGSWLGNLGKYTLKVSVMEGDTEDASFEI